MYKTEKTILRSFTCGQCVFGGGVVPGDRHVDCEKRSYRPHKRTAESCKDFKHRLEDHVGSIEDIQKSEYDGLPIRSKTALDLRTENQWHDAGKRIKPGEEGYEMHPSFSAKRTYVYFLPEQTY